MDSAIRLQPTPFGQRLAPPTLAWLLLVAAALAYCWAHAWVDSAQPHDALLSLRWALIHWGCWPLLLPPCLALVRRLQARYGVLLAGALVAPLAVLGATGFALIIDQLWGGQWTLQSALYRMLPVAGASYGFLLAAALVRAPRAERQAQPRADTAISTTVSRAGVRLTVSTGSREQQIAASAVDWIAGARNYAELHDGQTSYLLRTPLRELEAQLIDDGFLRVHRSHLVNRRRVKAVQQRRGELLLKLCNGVELPVGRSYRERVKAAFG